MPSAKPAAKLRQEDPWRANGELLERLVEAEVRFVLVGGLAVNAWGYLRATQDVDVVPDPDREKFHVSKRWSSRPKTSISMGSWFACAH